MSTSQPRLDGVGGPLSPNEQKAWRSFLKASTKLLEYVDQELQTNSSMTLTDYEILLALSETEDGRLRMSELAEEVLVSRSRLTYRVDRLVKTDWVTREECEDDRRGLWAILTGVGRQRLDEATPFHHRAIRQAMIDALGPELDSVSSAFDRIDAKLNDNS